MSQMTSSSESENEQVKDTNNVNTTDKTPKFRKNISIEKLAIEHHKLNSMKGSIQSSRINAVLKGSVKKSHDFETICFEDEEGKHSFDSQQELLSPEHKLISKVRVKKASKRLNLKKRKMNNSGKKINLATPRIKFGGMLSSRISSSEKILSTTKKTNQEHDLQEPMERSKIKLYKLKTKKGKKSKHRRRRRIREKMPYNNKLNAIPLELLDSRKKVKSKHNKIYPEEKKSKGASVKFQLSKSRFALEKNPVEHNNKQESHYIDEKMDEYLFLVMDCMKLFNFNMRDLRSEYVNIKKILKNDLKQKLKLDKEAKINQSIITHYLMPLVHYPSLIVIPVLFAISILQISSPQNMFFLNLAVFVVICKILAHKFFRLNLLKTPYQHAIIFFSMVFSGLTNLF